MADDRKKILIVEDDKPLSHALMLKLGHEGFNVEAAYDGEEALEKLNTQKYDLVILDLVMPRIDGFGVLAQLKARGDATHIIVLSNLSQLEDMNKAKELGATEYLIKSETSLLEIVNTARRIFSAKKTTAHET